MKKAKSFFTEKLKDIDLFGHPIELNFNSRGSQHNTVFGGFISIFIRSALLFYVVFIIHKMFTYANNTERNATFTLVMDDSQEESVSHIRYDDLRTNLFLVFRWQDGGHIDMTHEQLKPYIDAKAIQIDTDWNQKGENHINETIFEMRTCTKEDFGNSSTSVKYFESWKGFLILCPERTNKDGKDLTLNGAWGMYETSRL